MSEETSIGIEVAPPVAEAPILYTRKYPALPMRCESMQPDKLYVWNVDGCRYEVVKLHQRQDGSSYNGIVTLHDNQVWLFKHNLVGSVHGPIELQ